jgi:hypothetical protein
MQERNLYCELWIWKDVNFDTTLTMYYHGGDWYKQRNSVGKYAVNHKYAHLILTLEVHFSIKVTVPSKSPLGGV